MPPVRILVRVLAVLVGLPAMLLGLALLALPHVNLGPLLALRLAAALGRTVSVASLHVQPGRWVRLELRGVAVGNLAGGSRPAMGTLESLSAEVEARSLLHGPPVLRAVQVRGFDLLLEHTADGAANWRNGRAHESRPAEDRSWFPTLLDVDGRGIVITFRTRSGQPLRTSLASVSVTTADAGAPVRMLLHGHYNAVSVGLEARLASIATLRDARRPYGTALRLVAGGDTMLEFDGSMTLPLDFDGATGTLRLQAPSPRTLGAIGGQALDLAGEIALDGRLDHLGAEWRVTQGQGKLGADRFTAPLLRYREGPPGQPDGLRLEMAFPRLDLNPWLGSRKPGPGSEPDLPLEIAGTPDPLLEVDLSAATLAYAEMHAADARLVGALQPGRVMLEQVALTTFGTRFTGSGTADGTETGARVAAQVRMEEAESGTLGHALGLRSLPLSGRLDGMLAITSEGSTVNVAAHAAQVAAVLGLRDGQVAREVVEMAALDLRLLFRRARGTTPVTCLLGVVQMRDGVGTIAPLRIRAAEGTIAGTASFDLRRRVMDLVIGSQPSTTGFFALDIPVRVSGAFADPRIRPARWSAAGRALLKAQPDLAALPPALRGFARANACADPGSVAQQQRRRR